MNPNGVVTRASAYSVTDTIDRLQSVLQQHGATIYARIDQQAEVQKAGQTLPPLQYLLFGNPKAGGPIMAQNPVAALDLPLKIIAWQDTQNQVWLAYNDAQYIEQRYGLMHTENSPLRLEGVVNEALG
ncbi:MAG: DUF302 domain-containing protein [Sphingobacteriales bacterium]